MRSYFILKYLATPLKEYIFIFLTTIILIFFSHTKSFSEENVFTINNIKVKGSIDLNFSRDKYLNEAFLKSFQVLMNKILLTRDLKKVSGVKLNQIKKLISSFKIVEESYKNDEYKVNVKIIYNERKIKNFLGEKNVLFSQPESISVVFFPVLIINDEVKNFSENFFYRKWSDIKIENETINFILPIEDLEDISHITKMRDRIEDLNVEDLVNKYDVKNYIFTFMDYQNNKLNVHLKINFNNNKIRKNISYNVANIKDEAELDLILTNLKLEIIDLWKEENLVNVLMPLSIKLKFEHKKLEDLDDLRNIFYKINIIDKYNLEEFNINNSFFKIYYFGNPKKLRSELLKFGYILKNNQGIWQLYLND